MAAFDWAWRVVGANGNTITGAHNGTKSAVETIAQATAQRMRKLSCGDANAWQFGVAIPQDI